MKKNSFTYSFTSSKSPEEIYALLLKIDQWWFGLYDEKITGNSRKIGDEFVFKAGGGVHDTKQQLIELVPGKKIAWKVVDSNLSFAEKPDEWTGTTISFQLSKEGNKTAVTFTHDGLVPQFECYEACSGGWTGYLDNLKKKLK